MSANLRMCFEILKHLDCLISKGKKHILITKSGRLNKSIAQLLSTCKIHKRSLICLRKVFFNIAPCFVPLLKLYITDLCLSK